MQPPPQAGILYLESDLINSNKWQSMQMDLSYKTRYLSLRCEADVATFTLPSAKKKSLYKLAS